MTFDDTFVVGIHCSCLGAIVTSTDLKTAIPLLMYNIQLNRTIIEINCSGQLPVAQALEWGNEEHLNDVSLPFDLIVGSDISYDPQCFDPLISTLIGVTNDSTLCFFSHEYRKFNEGHEFSIERNWIFFEKLCLAGFETIHKGVIYYSYPCTIELFLASTHSK